MKVETLEYFIEVVCRQSINKAAKSLQLPQQTLSKNMQALERELGVKLFKRSAQGVRLTEAGEEVYRFARWCSVEYRGLWPNEQIEPLKQQLRLAMVETAAWVLLPPVMSLIYRKEPGLELQVQKEDKQQRIIELVQTKEAEAGIILCYQSEGVQYPPLSESVQLIPLYVSKPCFWVSKHSSLAAKKRVNFRDLLSYPLVSSDGADSQLMDLVMQEHDQRDQRLLWTDNIYYLAQLVKDDMAIAADLKNGNTPNLSHILSESAVALPLSKKDDYQLTTGALVHQEMLERAEIKKLLKILQESCQ